MGLIKAAIDSVSSSIGDQFKEYVTCPDTANNVIVCRGVVNHGKDNTNPSQGVISNGSAIQVPVGMAMMIVDNGKIVEFTAEDGIFTYDTSSQPSVFTGSLGTSIVDTIKTIGQRITFGGQTAADQRVYYVNIKEIMGNTFGSTQPEPIFDPLYGSVEITYNGEYSIKVEDPVILINNVVGSNAKDVLTYDDIFKNEAGGMNQLKSKFTQKVSEGIAKVMDAKQIPFTKVQMYKSEVTDEMKSILDADWKENYGIVVKDVTLRVNASESSRKIVQEMDAKVAETTRMGQVYSNNPSGAMAAATGEAMKTAAGNEAGAMMGFMGMGMASNQGANAMNAAAAMPQPTPAPEAPVAPNADAVAVAAVATPEAPAASEGGLSFCPDCGTPKVGKFCTGCGKKLED